MSVSVILPHRLSPSVAYQHLLSELIVKLDDGFPQPLIVKYSHKADASLQTLKNKVDDSKTSGQTLRLAQNGW